MRCAIFCFLIVLLVTPGLIYAQGLPYHLRTVSATDYIDAIRALVNSNREATADLHNLVQDFMRRYVTPDPSISFAELSEVYRAVDFAPVTWSADRAVWISALVSAWIKQHDIDLDRSPHFSFDLDRIPFPDTNENYQIIALPRDFIGNGGHEWLLTLSILTRGGGDELSSVNYLLATRDNGGNYHILTFPLPWVGCCGDVLDISNAVLQPQFFTDLIGDGHPLWVVTSSAYGYFDSGYVYVLAWRKGRMVDLARSPVSSESPLLEFPEGATLEHVSSLRPDQADILIRSPKTDNWGCRHTTTQTVRWDGSQWMIVQTNADYPNMAGCLWRRAETDMWAGNWQAAIVDYQAGFLKALTDTVKPKQELLEYMQFRLALAYLLNNQPLGMSVISTLLKLQPPTSDLMQQLYGILPRRPVFDSYPICLAAQDIFQRYQDAASIEAPDSFEYSALPTTIIVGMTWEDVDFIAQEPARYGPALPEASKAGCDISKPLLTHLRSHPFPVDELPATQLQKRGYMVSQALSLDINRDGHPGWLVWLTLDAPPLFFAPNPDQQTYHISEAPFRGSLHIFNGMIGTLPLHNGSVLVAITEADYLDRRKCPPTVIGGQILGWEQPSATLSILQLQSEELAPLLVTPACDSELISDFESRLSRLSQNGNPELPTSIDAYASVTTHKPGWVADLGRATYLWNDKTQAYQSPTQVDQQDETAQPTHDFEGDFDLALNQRNYQAALGVADQALLTPCAACTKETYIQYHFWRATVLEMMGRDSEAIAEYLFVVVNAESRYQYDLATRHLASAYF